MAKYNILVVISDRFGCGKFRSIDPHLMLARMYPDLFNVDIKDHNEVMVHNMNFPEFAKKYDLIHIHKEIDRAGLIIQMFKFLGKKVIVDLDDHYQLGQHHPMYNMSKQENWAQNVLKHVHHADLITTTTDIYKKILLRHNKNILVLPNAVNPEEGQFKIVEKKSDRLRVGIICGSSHLEDIKLLKGMISWFSKEELDKLQFVLCGFDTRGFKHFIDPDGTKRSESIKPQESVWYEYERILTNDYSIVSEDFKNKLHEFKEWTDCYDENEPYSRFWTRSIETYATHYHNIDILLVPLAKSEFNSVKSQLKVIEAGFHKKSIIASNFGPYTIDLKSILNRNGIDYSGNSILIDKYKSSKDWANAIKVFLNDRNLLKKTSENLYDTVKENYSLPHVTELRKEKYLELLEN